MVFDPFLRYMLDLETRVWASANGFPLIELWRGIRRPFQPLDHQKDADESKHNGQFRANIIFYVSRKTNI